MLELLHEQTVHVFTGRVTFGTIQKVIEEELVLRKVKEENGSPGEVPNEIIVSDYKPLYRSTMLRTVAVGSP